MEVHIALGILLPDNVLGRHPIIMGGTRDKCIYISYATMTSGQGCKEQRGWLRCMLISRNGGRQAIYTVV